MNLHLNRSRAESFGAEAALYDRARPSYPSELVDRLLERGPARVLDIGCGTGIAARLLRERGCEVLGVEPDPRMADFARATGLEVEQARVEQWQARGRRFELAISAQAWHWVDPDAGAHHVAAALVPDGEIAIFWNWGFPAPDLALELDEVYAKHAPGTDGYAVLLGATDERVQVAASGLERCGRFDEPRVESFSWSRDYSAAQWLENLRTHSDHATMDAAVREGLLGALSDVIAARGGTIRLGYETRLVSARAKPA